MRTHEQNLQTIEKNIEMFKRYVKMGPTEHDCRKLVDLFNARNDYKRHMAGEIERSEMCWTAIELTMEMPAWGTYGT